MIYERNRTTSSVAIVEQRVVAHVLRDAMDMVPAGESFTYQPSKPLGRWSEDADSTRLITRILNCYARDTMCESVFVDDNETPTFVVHKGSDW